MRFVRAVLRWSEQLTVRVTAYVAVTIVAFASVVVATNIRDGQEVILESLLARMQYVGMLVAELAASHVEELRAFELKVIIKDVAQQHDVVTAEIIDLNGHVIADGSNERALFARSDNPIVMQALATGEKAVQRSAEFVDAAFPVRLGEKLVGAVHLRLSLHGMRNGIAQLTARHIELAALLIGFAIPLAALFMIRATRQIRRVTGAARRIADGDLDFEFEETAKGEVGDLQRAFSHMKQALRDNIAENQRLAYTDMVTGLPNRQAFRRAMKGILQGDGVPARGAVLFLDLDRFKKVNDTYGHDVGDALLKLVSARLQRFLKDYGSPHRSVVARLGGDEFTLVLPGIETREDAQLLAGQIIDALSQPFMLEGQEIVVGASVGVTIFPDDSDDCDKLLRNADLAMYAAKDGGRQTLHAYSPELEQTTVKRLTLEGELRKALANKEFEVFYQPKVSCEDGRVVGAEALVRWQHPVRGLLSPGAFLSVAEEAGLIADLGWLVMEQSMMEASRFPPGDYPISLAINVSAKQFEEPDFAETVSDILSRSGLSPSLLELELTESIAMRDPERVIERITPLKARGVRFAIDDFGTGYSSLSYLTRLPVDTVKIDRSFVRAARSSVDDRALVTMILSMAESLNLKTVAEGVESEEDFAFVREHGATLAQGFLFSPPMTYQNFLIFSEKFRRRSGAPVKTLTPVQPRRARRA